jgi:dihydrofolate synthase/folylpolyglutamate synthase
VAAALSYDEALAALGHALQFGIRPSLDGIRALTDHMGRPQDAFRCIQVTGTNGKTSVTRACAALLRAHGHRVLAYTSPHLESYTERMEIDGRPIAVDDFAEAVSTALFAANAIDCEITEFELLTAAALWLARERDCGWAVLVVGMGGRWDATSVVEPVVAVVSGVGLDHTERLGDTVEAIAFDKAHIIKAGSVAVLGPGTEPVRQVFAERALGVGAHVVEVRRADPEAGDAAATFRVDSVPDGPGGWTALAVHGRLGSYGGLEVRAPSYQAPNVGTAVVAVESALAQPLDPRETRAALADLAFPGRFELVRETPPIVLDGAHNPQAARVLTEAIAEAWGPVGARPLALIGVLADKDARGIVHALAPHVAGFLCTAPDSPRALPAEALAEIAEVATGRPCPVVAIADLATDRMPAEVGDAGLVVTGSLYTVGQARTVLREAGEAPEAASPAP